ncbi:aldehyde dehydrogenase family protein [Mycoplasma sp. SG1]|uniref:aldehyde dehydrogenase family protein n=1 Tax=Mycoplasma sp. SG1 TaxID=2810348 RepID=UPI002023CB54|nr:aldehyde dehydrogenase family protein [Mycoplasma sp. SG1]URM53235.1 aldehyde dehydrogenase family protein [Mycoplasma sp. SG1]
MGTIKRYTYDWIKNFRYKDFYSIISPFTNKAIFEVPSLSKEDIDVIYEKSYQAFLKWRKTSSVKRVEMLTAWVNSLKAMEAEIINAIHWEVGKSIPDCQSEFKKGISVIEDTITEFKRLQIEGYHPTAVKTARNELALFEREPLGVILAISPFNYPFNLSITKLAPSLIMGNTVVFKPSTNGSVTGILITKSLYNAGFNEDQLQVITGKGSLIGEYLIKSDRIKLINYTGSTATGEYISKHSKNCGLIFEMGGKDPAIVLDDCDLKLTAKQIIKGAFSFNGQRCTAVKRILVTKDTSVKLIPHLKAEIEKLVVTNQPNTVANITPLINIASAQFVEDLTKDAIRHGAKVVIGNKFEDNLVYPTLLDNVSPKAKIASIEQFGPVLPIIYYDTIDEAIEIANNTLYGLQACVFSSNLKGAINIAQQIDTGRVTINFATERGPDRYPFTGSKSSGIGTQSTYWSLLNCSYPKGIVIAI